MNDTVTKHTFAEKLLGLIKLCRPKQWVKNGFVLAPLIFSSEFRHVTAIYASLLATLLFCIASSATYIVNDVRDIEHDRKHPKKSRTRPLAAGVVSVQSAILLLLLIYSALLWGGYFLPQTVLVILAYLLLNVAYTFFLKNQPVLDIFTIAIGFVLRVYAGAMALSVPLSAWMFVTTLCLALYLAAIKRRQELMQNGSQGRAVLEKYSLSLVDRYAEMSATGALVFYSMFVMSAKPKLVITIPLVLFGLFRYWYVVEHLEGGESPTDVLLSDTGMLLAVLLWILSCVWALWPNV